MFVVNTKLFSSPFKTTINRACKFDQTMNILLLQLRYSNTDIVFLKDDPMKRVKNNLQVKEKQNKAERYISFSALADNIR